MFPNVLRFIAGPSRMCSTHARALVRPSAGVARTAAAAPSAALSFAAAPRGAAVGASSQALRMLGQVRGMKVRSSVKKFCDGCSVVRR